MPAATVALLSIGAELRANLGPDTVAHTNTRADGASHEPPKYESDALGCPVAFSDRGTDQAFAGPDRCANVIRCTKLDT